MAKSPLQRGVEATIQQEKENAKVVGVRLVAGRDRPRPMSWAARVMLLLTMAPELVGLWPRGPKPLVLVLLWERCWPRDIRAICRALPAKPEHWLVPYSMCCSIQH